MLKGVNNIMSRTFFNIIFKNLLTPFLISNAHFEMRFINNSY